MTRIPLPGNNSAEPFQRGVEQGTGLWNQLLGRGIDLGRMHQQGQQFEKSHALAQQVENRQQAIHPYLIDQYKQQAALHPYIIEQYKQAAQMVPIERKYKEAQIDNFLSEVAQRKLDQQLLQQYMSGQNPQAQPVQPQTQQGPIPTSPMGFPRQGPMPGGQNVAPPSMEQIKQGLGGNKVHPYVASRIKKISGFDPNELTQDEKDQRALDLHRQKKEIDKEMKGEDDFTKPTKAVITQQQNIVAAGNNLIKQLDHLMKTKSPNRVGFITPGDRAAYITEANKAADTLMATYKWLGIESSLDMAKQMTTRQIGESDSDYTNRLKGLKEEAKSRIENAENILKTNKIESQYTGSNNKETNDPFGLRS